MSTGSSRLLLIIGAIFISATSLEARGLFVDPRTYFASIDTARASMTARESWIDLDGLDASLMTFETRIRRGPRVSFLVAVDFAAIRGEKELLYGIGDGQVSGDFKCAGDSLGASGLFLRASCRVPMGSISLAPFSYRSLDGAIGMEFREAFSVLCTRIVAFYTLTGEKSESEEMVHGRNSVLAGSLSIRMPGGVTPEAIVSWSRLHSGLSREDFLIRLSLPLSKAIRFSLEAARQECKDEFAAYGSLLGFSIEYRFPAAEAAKSQ